MAGRKGDADIRAYETCPAENVKIYHEAPFTALRRGEPACLAACNDEFAAKRKQGATSRFPRVGNGHPVGVIV